MNWIEVNACSITSTTTYIDKTEYSNTLEDERMADR